MRWFTPSWQPLLAVVLCIVAGLLGVMSVPEAAALARADRDDRVSLVLDQEPDLRPDPASAPPSR